MRPRASRHVQSLAAAALAALLAASAAAETRYALCVGIDRYSTAGSDLVSCVNDAHGVFTRLARDHARWDAADMTLMADSQATKAAIRNWFQSCPAVAGDLIVYYHSSHGGSYGGEDTYLCTYNLAQPYDDDELADDLANEVADGVKVIIVIDACYSGGMIEAVDAKAAPKSAAAWPFAANVMKKYRTIKAAKQAAAPRPAGGALSAAKALDADIGWITACRFSEVCSAGMPYSQFTDPFVGGFSGGADADSDGDLTFAELFAYAKARADDAGQTATSQETSPANVLTNTVAARTYAVPADPDEDWETGGSFPWTTYGDAGWLVTTSSAHGGACSVRSGPIGDNGLTALELDLATAEGEVSFWVMPSCEYGWDSCYFLVDGVIAGTFTGSTSGWRHVSYWVDSGTHTFTWAYVKDGSVSWGYDRVCLDDITFPNAPPVASATSAPAPPVSCEVGETVTFSDDGSTDPDGTVERWTWDFDTASTDDWPVVRAAPSDVDRYFASPGTYYVRLTVADNDGAVDDIDTDITVVVSPLSAPNDLDGDGLPDDWETTYGSTTDDFSAGGDRDGDGLPDAGEFAHRTDPADRDSDDDGYGDGTEVTRGSDPNDPASVPRIPAGWGRGGGCSAAGGAGPAPWAAALPGLAALVELARARRRRAVRKERGRRSHGAPSA